LFICGGAFDGIDKKIASRMQAQTIGYAASSEKQEIDKNHMLSYITPVDLKSFGMIPELIGRLPVLSFLNPLDQDALKRILIEPKNALLKQYKKLFAIDQIELEVDEDVIDFIVTKAIEFKLGARGLRSICEAIMTDLMFDLPSDKQTKSYQLTLKTAKSKFQKSKINQLKAA
jgi:ATP-dependent Clp protease ATP-binding subunit ClpX